MEKGIDLSQTRSLVYFDKLLGEVIKDSKKGLLMKEVSKISKKSVLKKIDKNRDIRNFHVGKYVEITELKLTFDHIFDNNEIIKYAVFWIGYCWKGNLKKKPYLWLEFDAKTCSNEYWCSLKFHPGTSGKYYYKTDLVFCQISMNAWIHFILKEEYLKQFYDENTDIKLQKEILAGFIDEVLGILTD